jgi:mono/diheme cytochrome c family protein
MQLPHGACGHCLDLDQGDGSAGGAQRPMATSHPAALMANHDTPAWWKFSARGCCTFVARRLPILIATIRFLMIAWAGTCICAVTMQPGHAMPADAQRPDNAESVAIGKSVAQQHCGGCHAIEASGASPNPKAPPFPLIAERYPSDNPAPVLIDGTVVRHPGMPEFNLIENETDGLVAYIRRVSRRWKPTP